MSRRVLNSCYGMFRSLKKLFLGGRTQPGSPDSAPDPRGAENLLQDVESALAASDRERARETLKRIAAAGATDADVLDRIVRAARGAGNVGLAVEPFARALRADPGNARLHSAYGNLRYEQGDLDAAAEAYARAAAIDPGRAEVCANLGMIACARRDFEQGIRWLDRAIELDPRMHRAHHNLGLARQELGQPEAAVTCFRQALALEPESVESRYCLGTGLQALGQYEAAADAYHRAQDLRPDDPELLFHLGRALQQTGHAEQACACLSRAVKLRPDFHEAHNDLGIVLMEKGDLDGAIHALKTSTALSPGFAAGYNNLAMAWRRMGRLDQAVDAFRDALRVRPDFWEAHSNLVYALNFLPEYEPERVFAEHAEWARRHAEPLTAAARPHANARTTGRVLRVGYVSPNFRDHAVAYFFESTLVHHDPRRVLVHCYADVARADSFTERLRHSTPVWRDIARRSDDSVADLVRQDSIDILVDLTGHTDNHRLLLFARKPAPVQVTWNGYANTTGMSAMDYRITDAYADPPGMTEHLHSEKLVRLPDIYMTFNPPRESPPVGSPPVVSNGYVTFGSFNALAKVTPQVIATWSRILHAVADAKLIVLTAPSGSARERLVQAFSEHGVASGRLEFLGRLAFNEFLAAHGRADIALDPFPFNGTTTTCHTLWMGVPVITLAGKSHVSRVGVSMLSNVGLPQCVAMNENEYVEKAVAIAMNRSRLQELRSGMREQMLSSSLTDAARHTRFLEDAYVKMWEDYCCDKHG